MGLLLLFSLDRHTAAVSVAALVIVKPLFNLCAWHRCSRENIMIGLQVVQCGRRRHWPSCSQQMALMLTQQVYLNGQKSTLALRNGKNGKVKHTVMFVSVITHCFKMVSY